MYCRRKEAKLLAYEYDSGPADRRGKYSCSTTVSCLLLGVLLILSSFTGAPHSQAGIMLIAPPYHFA